MMRGAGFWAIAVRRPDDTVHVESHEIDSVVLRVPLLGKPFFRGSSCSVSRSRSACAR